MVTVRGNRPFPPVQSLAQRGGSRQGREAGGLAPTAWLARHPPEWPALVIGEAVLTYGALRARADRLAGVLGARGLTPGSTIAAVTGSAELLALLAHAAPRAGLALLPLGRTLPRGVREALLGIAAGAPVLADAWEDAAGGPWIPTDEALTASRRSAAAPAPPAPLSIREVHLICATSGSAGTPKGVMLTGDNLAAAVAASAGRIPLAPGDAWLACVPLHHIAGLSILYRCAAAGARVVLHGRFEAERVLLDLGRHAVTHLSLVPAMLTRLLDAAADRPPPGGLRVVLVGGGALDPTLLRRARRAGWPVCPTYGLTEAGSQVATLWPPPGEDWQPGLVGRPLDGVELRLAAPGPDGTGRIEVRGPMVTIGYASADRTPGAGLVDGWLATGDLGRLDTEGRLTVIGRADEVLVSGGEKVQPEDVERVLAACPGVDGVAVTARPDPTWGDRLVAVWVGPATADQVERWARDHLHGAWRPREFLSVSDLPRIGPGKLDRRALRRLLDP